MKTVDIFYADDDEDDFLFFNDAIEKISTDKKPPISLHLHKNGESLLENIKKNRVKNGVVFLDINMPKKSGFKLLEEIRSEVEIKQVPVIMYSSSYNDSSMELSYNLGANFFVVKPHNFHDLISMINRILNIDWKRHKVDLENFIYSKEK